MNGKGGTAAFCARILDSAFVSGNNLGSDREPQARPIDFGGFEELKRIQILGNPDPCIGN
jgi:hypothetical protein